MATRDDSPDLLFACIAGAIAGTVFATSSRSLEKVKRES